MRKLNEIYPNVRDVYYITTCGKIISIRKGKLTILKATITKDGYRKVCPKIKDSNNRSNRTQNIRIASAVLKAFGEKQPVNTTCDHIDRIRTNDFIQNLRWLTPKEQQQNRGKQKIPKNSKKIKVIKNNKIVFIGYVREVVEKFKLSRTAIYGVLSKKTINKSCKGYKFIYE